MRIQLTPEEVGDAICEYLHKHRYSQGHVAVKDVVCSGPPSYPVSCIVYPAPEKKPQTRETSK